MAIAWTAVRGEVAQNRADGVLVARVERAERLAEEQQPRAPDKRLRRARQLVLAAQQPIDPGTDERRESESIEDDRCSDERQRA